MPNKPLGNEWGALAGRDPEEVARQLAAYATELEGRIESRKVGDDDDDGDDAPDPALDVAKKLHGRTMQPVATEFIGQRESAKSKARQYLKGQGFDWDLYADYVDQAMANTSPDQQINPNAWAEAWWYIWGTAKRAEELQRRAQPDDQDLPPARSEPARRETTVERGNMNADRDTGRGTRTAPRQWDIPDEERATKRKFERHLGIKMSDEEWVRLQSEEDPINTYEAYQAVQEKLTAGVRR